MLDRLKYLFALIKNGPSTITDLNEKLMDRYLGHHKIIGWYDGSPVYSSFLIPGLSGPHANALVQRFMSLLRHEPLPAMVNISVTDTCNAACEHCSFFGAMDSKEKTPLKNQDMKKIISDCQDFGLSVINFVGGEPLLRKDLSDLVKHIDKSKSVSSVFTNGWYLPEKAGELYDAGTLSVNVSLDSTDRNVHDGFRKLEGLFDRAVDGIKKAQKYGMLTGISTTVTQKDLENGELEKRIEFARDEGINELLVFDIMPVGMYSHRADLSARPVDRKMLFSIIAEYNKKRDLPGIFSYTRFRDPSVMGCSAGRNYFYIGPYGDVYPCDFTAKPVGNLTKEPLYSLWSKLVNERKGCGNSYMNECCNLDSLENKNDSLLPILNN